MRPTSIRFPLAVFGAALGIAALVSVRSDAHPHEPPPVQLKKWIQDTRVADLTPCPSPIHQRPLAFTFNKKVFEWCLVDGPYKWDDKDWYVQRIKGIGDAPTTTNPTGGPWNDVIRVCSPQAVGHEGTESPCGPAGPGGCKNCMVNGVPQ
jgi:hypothetical protein